MIRLVNISAPFLVNERVHMPLGLMYLHEYLTSKGMDVPQITDLSQTEPSEWKIPEGKLYGISATTPQYPLALIAKTKIKEMNRRAKVIIGGAHASAMPNDCYYDGFDYVVMGEGEKVLFDIVSGKIKQPIVCYPKSKDIDIYPYPKLTAIDIKNYTQKITFAFQGQVIERNSGWLFSSRGCPQKCTFCASPLIWESKIRMHSMGYMKEWLKYWQGMGVEDFYFPDEQIAVSKRRLFDICEMMSSIKGYWKCQVRGDTMTEEKLKAMYDSGCRQIHLGVETGSQRMLDWCKKNETVEQVEHALVTAHKCGLGVKAGVLVGLPTETQADVDMTAAFLKRTQPEEVIVSIFVPYPGCNVFHAPEKNKYKLSHRDWSEYYSLGKETLTPVIDKEREEEIHRWRLQLLDVCGKSDQLMAQKERWESWKS